MTQVASQGVGGRVLAGRRSDFSDGDRVFVEVDRQRVGVFRVGDDFVAYLNVCPHQGGPVCEGQYFPEVTAEVGPRGELVQERLAYDKPHLVCPWHGWEYDIRTGEMAGDRRIRLRKFRVTVDGDDVYVEP